MSAYRPKIKSKTKGLPVITGGPFFIFTLWGDIKCQATQKKITVVSLYDFTTEAVKPWANLGYSCYCFDIQHGHSFEEVGSGSIYKVHADLHQPTWMDEVKQYLTDADVAFVMGFPVCTDLAVSGAAHFKSKAARDPEFQTKAASYAMACATFADYFNAPYLVENPVSRLATLWRRPDYKFHPYEYGGYVDSDDAEHPKWPQYIAASDAYKKLTCLWTGNGFVMPPKSPVDPEAYHGNGYSTSMMKLGGKSQRTKDIRSATPRGFAKAVFEANSK